MSSTSNARRFTSVRAATGAVALVVLAGLTFGRPIGADFEDHESVSVTGSFATMDLSLSGGSAAEPADIDFDNMVPGETRSESVTPLNNGSISGRLTLQVLNPDGTGIPIDQLDMLRVGTDKTGLLTLDELQGQGGVIDLGVIEPGETLPHSVQISLDQQATNAWQGGAFDAEVLYVLKQLN